MYILPNKITDGKLYTATNKQTGEVFKFTSPALFNKHTATRGIVDRAFLNQKGETRIWKFTKENAPVGYKWRQQFFVDQLVNLIDGIKKDPHGRRHLLSAWNPGELDQMALPPCHILAQFYVNPFTQEEITHRHFAHRMSLPQYERHKLDEERAGRVKTTDDLKTLGLPTGKLSCQMYQRSADFPLGVPFNITSYSLLTHMVAQVCNLEVDKFIHVIGDAHIYINQIPGVKEQLLREPLPAPQLWLNPEIKDITKFTMDDIKLIGYQSHPAINFPFAT